MDPGKAGASPSHHRVCSTEPALSTGTPSSASSRVRRIGHGRTRGGDRALRRAHDAFALAMPAGGVAPCCLRPTRAAVRRAAGLKPSGREHGTAAGAHGQATRDGGDKGKLEADRGEEAIACEHQRMRGTERHGRSTARDVEPPSCGRGRLMSNPGRAGRREGPAIGDDRLDAAGPALLQKTAGVPPRGFEPLVSTLKGWRPRPLDDGGAGRRRV